MLQEQGARRRQNSMETSNETHMGASSTEVMFASEGYDSWMSIIGRCSVSVG